MQKIPKATTPPSVKRVSVKQWIQGTVTAYDDGRTPSQGLRSSANVMLQQDGTVRPRPSLTKYGPQPVGTVLGEIYEFRTLVGLTPTNWMICLQKVTQNEVQTLSITGAPTGGTFTLTYAGQTTSALAYNAAAATVQTALVALSNVGSGQVTCAGGVLPGTPITITFAGTLANTDVALITSTSSLTGGTAPAISIVETVKGGFTTYAHIAKGEDTTWTKILGKTYDNTATAQFCQIQSKILIMNGSDTLSYFDATSNLVVAYTALTTPVAMTLDTLTSLTGTVFNVYYATTSNSTVGETDTSPILSQPVSTDRDLWNPATQSVKIDRTAVTGEKSWNVYMGISADGAGVPTMYLIASGLDATILSFTDNGTRAQDLTRPAPKSNSTAGPRVSRGDVINGRPWIVGDKDNPFYVRRGGDYGFELDFSPANGGGFSPIGNGTKELPVRVISYRNGKGDALITVLTQGTNGHGKRYNLTPTTLTFGSSSFVVYEVAEDSGQDGTDSPNGVITYNNSLWYPSRDGFKTTGTKPQLQNVLSTDRVSNTIQGDISTLNNSAMSKCVGLPFEGRLYWALPVGSNTNNQIWVLDLDRGGAWMKPWTVAADWMMLYNDNNGNTHFIVLSNNSIYEFNYVETTADDGVPFITSGDSGQITFSPDGREWGRLIQLVFVLLRPQGTINLTVSAKTTDADVAVVGYGVSTRAATATRAGWSEPRAGWSSLRGWSQIVTVPTAFNSATQEVIVEVDEDVQWYSYGWESSGAGTDYNFSDVIAEFVNVGIKDLS